MIAVARYLLAEHTRSRRFVAALLVLAAGVIVLYAQPPNPVLSTGGTVAAFLFPIGCWLALALFDSQGDADRRLLAASVGGALMVGGRLLAAAALAGGASLFALAVALARGAVERAPHLDELGLLLGANLLSTLGGAALAALFAAPIVRSRAIAVIGVRACVLATIPLRLPPFIPTARALDVRHAARVPGRIAAEAGEVRAFVLVASALGGRQWRRRE